MTPTTRRRSGRLHDALLLGAPVMLLLAWLAFLLVEAAVLSDPVACDLQPGRSIFGAASWGAFPPGVTCTWTDLPVSAGTGVDHVDSPPPARLALTAVLVAWPLSLLYARRRSTGGGV